MDLDALSQWLDRQPDGIATLRAYQEHCLAGIAQSPDEAAARQLLNLAAERFVFRYDGMPLDTDTAKRAHDRLIELTRSAADGTRASPEDQVRVLNRLARADLG